ncbi:hypothetical protein PR048_018272 [Dryococelus australis]|uniref:Elongation of very long chain fatty acids protein n=1 Tax=Dryococelus australis TaxID=614101 RepID=A0ABQ9HBX9_9NEOP|nr:hypothetical protein PR048_018272 [Dryococelus australis]
MCCRYFTSSPTSGDSDGSDLHWMKCGYLGEERRKLEEIQQRLYSYMDCQDQHPIQESYLLNIYLPRYAYSRKQYLTKNARPQPTPKCTEWYRERERERERERAWVLCLIDGEVGELEIMSVEGADVGVLADPRVNQWSMMGSPIPTLAICLSYAYFAKVLGPRLMENKKPFDLRQVLIVYNFLQMVFSAWIFNEDLVWLGVFQYQPANQLAVVVDVGNLGSSVRDGEVYLLEATQRSRRGGGSRELRNTTTIYESYGDGHWWPLVRVSSPGNGGECCQLLTVVGGKMQKATYSRLSNLLCATAQRPTRPHSATRQLLRHPWWQILDHLPSNLGFQLRTIERRIALLGVLYHAICWNHDRGDDKRLGLQLGLSHSFRLLEFLSVVLSDIVYFPACPVASHS